MRNHQARRQRGAVAVLTGLTIAVMIGFLGIAVDLGRLFVAKAELQTAMDACALAAASALRPGAGDTNVLNRARAFGLATLDPSKTSVTGAARPATTANRVEFQDRQLVPGQVSFAFGSTLDNLSTAYGDNNAARYVRCTYPLEGVAVYFMRVLGGPTAAEVGALATATIGPSSGATCLFPVVMCVNHGGSPTDPFGMQRGQWLSAVTKDNNEDLGPGKFGWANFDGGSGSASEISGWIKGDGFCGTPAADLSSGQKASGSEEWNSRFGLYRGGSGQPSVLDSPPDFTGSGFPPVMQSGVVNAYGAGAGDTVTIGGINYKTYLAASRDRTPFTEDPANKIPGLASWIIVNPADPNVAPRKRRVVPIPVLDCAAAQKPIVGTACGLLLHPIFQSASSAKGDPVNAHLEFLGTAEEFSDCKTSGAVGGTSRGPLVPVLVQ